MKITKSKTIYYNEETPESLDGFLNWTFTSGGTTGQDYKIFDRAFVKYINKVAEPLGLRVCNYSPNHYCSSGFVTDGGKRLVYFSISDVRFFKNDWYNHILIRTAEHDRDYTGGRNCYTDLEHFAENVKRLLGV